MDLLKRVLEIEGFPDFNPVQKEAIKKGIFKNNLVISSPTSSGKTLIGTIAALKKALDGKKCLYTCPLKALAYEHFARLKERYAKPFDIKATISTGDFDSSSSYLAKYSIIFSTYEKVVSLITHKASWLNSIDLLIVDEIHELDSDRGIAIEMLISMLLSINPQIQIIALSATIPNAKEISKWLKAELVESDFRPVPLKEGVYFSNQIFFQGNEKTPVNANAANAGADPAFSNPSDLSPLDELILDTVSKNKQSLIFCDTRKRTLSLCEKTSEKISSRLTEKEKRELKKLSSQILSATTQPTEQCHSLSKSISKGVAFHHAGLLSKQRRLIEDAFRERKLKALFATPTLAAGVNTPSYRVILPYLYRFSSFGSERISVREAKQMLGRAGRPSYDSVGEGVFLAKTKNEVMEIFDSYINAPLEEINSRLSRENILRTYLLILIANDFVFDLSSMERFFSLTFYATQFCSLSEIFLKLNNLLKELNDMNFVELNAKGFKATPIGKRVAELYLDPLSAYSMIETLKRAKQGTPLNYLYLICDTSELYPYLPVYKSKELELYSQFEEQQSELWLENNKIYTDTNYLNKFFLAKVFLEWINEATNETILQDYNVQPGILRSKLQVSDWLLYSACELSKLLKLSYHLPNLTRLRLRMKHGIKEELLPLIQLNQIGRVRARRLFSKGIRTVSDLKRTGIKELSNILPQKIALKVKAQLEGNEKALKRELQEQKELAEF